MSRAGQNLPLFEGERSRRHRRVPYWRLRLAALPRPFAGPRLDRVQSFVQFVGFPRSGHSLLGALIDAHPEAIVAHELDAMGLVGAGFGYRAIARLIVRNSAAFAAHGQWWNGYSYAVPGAPPAAAAPWVIGDKKGDWAARRSARVPGLVEKVAAIGAPHPRWLLVTRDPRDNIATMTMRLGGHYDRLRIEGGAFREALAAAQADGRIAAEISDEMIADYRSLCEAIAGMKARIPAEDWLEIRYETFTAAPREGLERICRFLGLSAEPGYLDACAAIVHPGGNPSRDRLAWRPEQREAVADIIRDFDFLDYEP